MTAQLDATGVAKSFGPVAALRNASLSVRAGEVHALLGANGAGKSTLINLLCGEIQASGGPVELLGSDVSRSSQPRRARAGLGRSYKRTTIYAPFTAAENCRLSAPARLYGH